MRLFLKILFFILSMITTVGEVKSSTRINYSQKENAISVLTKANLPGQVRQMSKFIGPAQDVGTVAETGLDAVGMVPGVETVVDFAGAVYYGVLKGDKETSAYYVAGLTI